MTCQLFWFLANQNDNCILTFKWIRSWVQTHQKKKKKSNCDSLTFFSSVTSQNCAYSTIEVVYKFTTFNY